MLQLSWSNPVHVGSAKRRRGHCVSPVATNAAEVLEERTLLAGVGVPNILTPTGVLHDAQPTFEWTAVNGATRYELAVRNLSTGQINVIHEQNLTTTSFTPNVPMRSGLYRFQVRAFDDQDAPCPWSAPTDFSVRTRVELIGPNGATTSTPTFRWFPSVGATTYDLWVRNTFTGQDQVIREQSVVGTEFTPASALADGQYRFWVRAADENGFHGGWSDPMDFTIGDDFAQVPFRFISPIDVSEDLTPTFEWTHVPGITRWDLWVRNLTTGQDQVIREQTLAEPRFTSPEELSIGDYQFWVRGYAGAQLRMQWTDGGVFFLGQTPQLSSPGTVTQDSTPTFSWNGVAQAVRYDLWVNRDGVQDQIIRRQFLSGTSFTSSTPLADGDYTAWVRAFDANGVATRWSRPLNFTINRVASNVASAQLDQTFSQGVLSSGAASERFGWYSV